MEFLTKLLILREFIKHLFYRWEHLVYQMGGTSEIISHVIHKGEVVHCNKQCGSEKNSNIH